MHTLDAHSKSGATNSDESSIVARTATARAYAERYRRSPRSCAAIRERGSWERAFGSRIKPGFATIERNIFLTCAITSAQTSIVHSVSPISKGYPRSLIILVIDFLPFSLSLSVFLSFSLLASSFFCLPTLAPFSRRCFLLERHAKQRLVSCSREPLSRSRLRYTLANDFPIANSRLILKCPDKRLVIVTLTRE